MIIMACTHFKYHQVSYEQTFTLKLNESFGFENTASVEPFCMNYGKS